MEPSLPLPQKHLSSYQHPGQIVIWFVVLLFPLLILTSLTLDMGLIYLAQARLSRALDGATAMSLQSKEEDPLTLALRMRIMTISSYPSLQKISNTPERISQGATYHNQPATREIFIFKSLDDEALLIINLLLDDENRIVQATASGRAPLHQSLFGFQPPSAESHHTQ